LFSFDWFYSVTPEKVLYFNFEEVN
jgi:hypothetical protein